MIEDQMYLWQSISGSVPFPGFTLQDDLYLKWPNNGWHKIVRNWLSCHDVVYMLQAGQVRAAIRLD